MSHNVGCVARVVFLLSLLFCCHGFSRGPPWKMCSLKIPKHHGKPPQLSQSPFGIKLSKYSYSPGDNITVTLKSSTSGVSFRGFVVGAHAVRGDTENVVGKFVRMPINSKGLSWYAEGQNEPNCVSHNSNSDKTEISFIWQASGEQVGDVHFIAAFAQNFSTFWANVRSQPVRSIGGGIVPPFPAKTAIKSNGAFRDPSSFMNYCGRHYGCIYYPSYCKPSDCEIMVKFALIHSNYGTFIRIKMIAMTPGYISLAVSDDRFMTDDFTMTCTVKEKNEFASLQNGYNPAYNNERHRVYNYSEVQVFYNNGQVYCSFVRPLEISITTVKVDKANVGSYSSKSFDLRTPRYVFLATGTLFPGTDVLYKHRQDPIITTSKVDFQSTKIYYAASMPMLVQLHASSMLIAWMVLAGLGMILAGNFKEIIIKMACGARLWFQLHRGVMLSTTVLAVIGLILILVYGWRERAVTHGAVGLTALSLTAIQVLMGIARPDIDSKRRIIFNWAHFLVGNGIHIFAAITMILAFMMPHLPETMRKKNLIVVIVWIVMQVVWVIAFRVLRHVFCDRSLEVQIKDRDTGNSPQMQVEESGQSSQTGNRVLLVALGFYIFTMLVFFAVCITYVVIY